jgi:hypothetical protein
MQYLNTKWKHCQVTLLLYYYCSGQFYTHTLKTGKFSFIFCQSEKIVNNKTVQGVFSSDTYMSVYSNRSMRPTEWGEDFRKDYQNLYQSSTLNI